MDVDLTCEYCKGGGWFSDDAGRYRCHECWGHGRRRPTPAEWDTLRAERDQLRLERDGLLDRREAADRLHDKTMRGWANTCAERDRYKAALDQVADAFNARDAVTETDAEMYATDPGGALSRAGTSILADLTTMMEAAHCEARRAVALDDHVRALLAVQDEDCRFDHHGYCQAHYVEQPCRVALARAALDAEPAPPPDHGWESPQRLAEAMQRVGRMLGLSPDQLDEMERAARSVGADTDTEAGT